MLAAKLQVVVMLRELTAVFLVFSVCFSPPSMAEQSLSATPPIEVVPYTTHADNTKALAISPDGKIVVTASGDSTVKIWDRHGAQLIRTMRSERIRAMAMTGDGGQVVVASSMQPPLQVWRLVDGAMLREIEESPTKADIKSLALTPDNKYLVAGYDNGQITIWEFESGKQLRAFTAHQDSVGAMAVTKDGRLLVTADQTLYNKKSESKLKIWELATGQLVRTLDGHDGKQIDAVAFSPDGKTVVSGGHDEFIRVWSLETGLLLHKLRDGEGTNNSNRAVKALAITFDGKRIISGGYDKSTYVWNLGSGELLSKIKTPANGLIAVTPDDREVVIADKPDVASFDLATGKSRARYTSGQSRSIQGSAISSDGTIVYTAEAYVVDERVGSKIMAWDLRTRRIEELAITKDRKSVV